MPSRNLQARHVQAHRARAIRIHDALHTSPVLASLAAQWTMHAAFGEGALASLPSGDDNIAFGYHALNLLSTEKKLLVEFKTFAGLGAMVQSIDGLANDAAANKFWIYYVNGQSAQVGISSYVIKPNDLIEWKYEANQF